MATRLGEKLHELRKQKKLTLDALAEQAGLSKSYLWELENRESQRPSAEKLSALADALGVAVSYLLKKMFALLKNVILTKHSSATTKSLIQMLKSNSGKYWKRFKGDVAAYGGLDSTESR